MPTDRPLSSPPRTRNAPGRRIRRKRGNWQAIRAVRYGQQVALDWAERIRADERERIAQAVAELLIDAACLALDDNGEWTVIDNLDPISLIEIMPELDAALAAIARGDARG